MILLLGGTSDARALAADMRAAGYDVLLTTVSDYGARLAEPTGAEVRAGALDDSELTRLVADADVVVDATHPFAETVSRAAVLASARAGRPYLRFLRPAGELGPGVVRASDASEAARRAVEIAAGVDDGESAGTIFLTVGSKTVSVYARAARAAGVRVVARVLPTPESLAACSAAGLEPGEVIAMQGPTSAELDAAMLRHLGATVLVTKESGAAGGLGEKLRAADLAGTTAVVVDRPTEPAPAMAPATSLRVATTSSEVLVWLAQQPRLPRATPQRHLPRGLLQVFTGDGKGKTTAATGQALRARGAGLAVTFVQFVKGGRESAELAPLRAAGVHVVRSATQKSGLLRGTPTSEDRAAAAAAWTAARAALADADRDLVVLDELHAALRHGLVDLDDVLAALAARPGHQEVVTTGRGAPDALLGAAHLVTEMTPVRHPYPDVPARRGVEF